VNARGTRRPHSTRAYKRDHSLTRGGGKPPGSKSFLRELLGCAVLLAALAALPVTVAVDVIWGLIRS
jgi:hypothetical protein